jgi:cytochrome c oxidase subunit 1
LIVFHFVVPFLLLSRFVKRRAQILGWVAAGLIVMSVVDMYWLTVPAFERAGPEFHLTDWLAILGVGGLTGLFLATLAVDTHVHDTYFVVGHFHYIMVGGAVMGYLGGIHYWWPKITGRLYPDGWARLAAASIFIGFNLTFFPQYMLGYLGMPRRYAIYPPEFQVLNVMSSAGASILGVGYLIPLVYMIWSIRYGPVAGPNPWGAKGLEWQTPSPPPTENFPETPVVTEEAYAYGAKEVAVG